MVARAGGSRQVGQGVAKKAVLQAACHRVKGRQHVVWQRHARGAAATLVLLWHERREYGWRERDDTVESTVDIWYGW